MKELISINQACQLTSLSRTTIWYKIKSGEFPKTVYLGGIRKAFVKSEIEEWIEARVAERDELAA